MPSAPKRKYRAVVDGQVFTRKTHRTYTHLVVGNFIDWRTKKYTPHLGTFGWAGRKDLAEKVVNHWAKVKEQDGRPHAINLKIVPVEEVTD